MRSSLHLSLIGVAVVAVACCVAKTAASAQDIERAGKHDTSEPAPQFRPAQKPVLNVPTSAQAGTPQGVHADTPTIILRSVEFSGNVRISSEQIRGVTTPYIGRNVTVEDLLRMRDEITQLYVKAGLVSSGARLVEQDFSGGIVRVEIVEGTLEAVPVFGTESLSAQYIRDRFHVAQGDVVDVRAFESRFRDLLDDPSIAAVDAQLMPGSKPGDAILALNVREADRNFAQFKLADDRSPSIGGIRASVNGFTRNLFFDGDLANAEIGRTEGLTDLLLAYGVPLTADDCRLALSLEGSDAKVVEEPLTALDVVSQSVDVGVGITYPVYRLNAPDFAQKLLLTGQLEYSLSQTSLGGIPFSFSPGAVEGRTEYIALRFTQQFVDRREASVLAASSTFNVGLWALTPAAPSSLTPSENFFFWHGEAQYVRHLTDFGLQLVASVDGQLAADTLFVEEKMTLGGLHSVRGYRKNETLGDNGVQGTVELQLPVLNTGTGDARRDAKDLSLSIFADGGRVWNAAGADPANHELFGVGAGLIWTPTEVLSIRLEWARGLTDTGTVNDPDIQDRGVYFQISRRVW